MNLTQIELVEKSLSAVAILSLATAVVALWLAYRSEARERLADSFRRSQELLDERHTRLQKDLDTALLRIQALEIKVAEEQDSRVQELLKNREGLIQITLDSNNAVDKLAASLDAVVAMFKASRAS